MGTVEFNEERTSSYTPTKKKDPHHSLMTNLLIKSGIVSNAQQAGFILLAVALIAVGLSAWILYTTFDDTDTRVYREDIPPEIWEQLPPSQQRKIPERN